MKKIRIKEGKHYPFPGFFIPIPILVCKRGKSYRRRFAFTDSCMYDLKDEDQLDCNKLFGFSIGHHHKNNSFRFGWRADLNKKKIEILYYAYIDGVRQKPIPLIFVNPYALYTYEMIYNPKLKIINLMITDTYEQKTRNSFTFPVESNKLKGLGYKLGTYFGGNEKAPQDIVIFNL
ncbi:MAG: hypothetical protein ACOC33_02735 [bacterium]